MSLCCTLMAAAGLAYVRRAGLYLDTLAWTTFTFQIAALTQGGRFTEKPRVKGHEEHGGGMSKCRT